MVKKIVSSATFLQRSAKRQRGTDQDLLTHGNGDLNEVTLLVQEDTVPAYLKTTLGHVLEDRDRYAAKDVENEQKNRELAKKNAKLRAEIDRLMFVSALSRESTLKLARSNNSYSPDFKSFEEEVYLRSIVIIGVLESSDSCASNRLTYDPDCVRRLFDFLAIACMPVTLIE
ncbi:hypothetical protein Aduo_012381 [Ancylostoma duodenale]